MAIFYYKACGDDATSMLRMEHNKPINHGFPQGDRLVGGKKTVIDCLIAYLENFME